MTEIIIIINSQVMGLRGGGGKKVIKTIVKSKSTEKTVDTDRSVYEQAFMNAMEVHKVTRVSFKEIIKTMALPQLELLRDFILHHKSNNDKKAMAIAEYLPIFDSLNTVAMKVNAAIEHTRQLTYDSLSDECGDEEGNIKMSIVLEAVKFRIEHKKEEKVKGDEMAI